MDVKGMIVFVIFFLMCFQSSLGNRGEVTRKEFEKFQNDVYKKINTLKNTEQKLREEIAERDIRLQELENHVTQLDQKCNRQEVPVAKRQRGLYREEQVAFTAYSDHHDYNLTHDQIIIYNQVLLNDGNHYNPATGLFTAPLDGVYLFSYSVGAKVMPGINLTQNDVFTHLVVDNVTQLSAVAESTDTYDDEQGSSTAIIFMKRGSQAWTIVQKRGGNDLYSADNERITSFTGALLYPRETTIDSGLTVIG